MYGAKWSGPFDGRNLVDGVWRAAGDAKPIKNSYGNDDDEQSEKQGSKSHRWPRLAAARWKEWSGHEDSEETPASAAIPNRVCM